MGGVARMAGALAGIGTIPGHYGKVPALGWQGGSGFSCLAVHPRHYGVEAAVDVGDFASDAGGQIGKHERSGVADVLDGHVTAQGRVLLDELEDQRSV